MIEPTSGRWLSSDQSQRILPHRYPFLLIDRVLDVSLPHGTAIKWGSVDAPFIPGPVPCSGMIPGQIRAESMAADSAFVGFPLDASQEEAVSPRIGMLGSMTFKWSGVVMPKVGLRMTVETKKALQDRGAYQGAVPVADQRGFKGDFTVYRPPSPTGGGDA